jgi:LuxR family transcriptional regulator, maltose regulon positive regulatory protein
MDVDVQVGELIGNGWQALGKCDWEEAHSLFRAAVSQAEIPEALEGLGVAAWWEDNQTETFEAHEIAYRLYQERDDRRGAARVAFWLSSNFYSRRGEYAIANGWIPRAHRLLDGLDPGPELAMVTCWECYMAIIVEHDTAKARRLSDEAALLGHAVGAPELELYARTLDGYIRICEGDTDEGIRMLDESGAAIIGGDTTDPSLLAMICCFMIWGCERVRDVERASQWCAKLREHAESWSYSFMFSYCRTHYAGVLMEKGAWQQAETELTLATEELSVTHPAMVVEGIIKLADLRRRQGRFDEAAALFARLDEHPLRMLGNIPALLGRATLALDEGDPTSAADFAERYLRAVSAGNRMEQVPGFEVLVRAHVALGDYDQAATTLRELIAITTDIPSPALRAAANFSEGVVSVATGDYEGARKRFEDAVDLFDRSGSPYEVARSRLELASVLAALGRVETAKREATKAFESLDWIGASRESARAATLLRQLDSTGNGSESTPRDSGLTLREIEVLRLIAKGQGDKEIAVALGLSEHTVHRHISNVLTKLGLPSRSAAVAHAAQQGLL